jgi:cell division protein FtsI/penicillin-binding protein 2
MNRPPASRHPRARRRRRLLGLARLGLLIAVLIALAVLITSLGAAVAPGKSLAENFAAAWGHRDWLALYDDIDADARATVSLTQFERDYSQAYATATVTSAQVAGDVREVGGSEAVPLRIHTRVFGTFRETYTLPLTGSGDATRIIWHPDLAFPGLFPGETVHRVLTAPQRGELLARDGVPLSNYASTGNIIGSIGPASGSQLAALTADGFSPATDVGLSGLEYLFQNQLAGRPGGELFVGQQLAAHTRPVQGVNVRTSVDPELQNAATTAFSATGTDGGILMMVPKNGELLAAAGSPLSQTQPPGSTFKIVTATGVLEAGLATLSSTYPYGTYALIDGYKLHNSDGEDCGGTLINAFAVSCNSVYAPLGVRLGAQRLVAAADAYGFDSPSPLTIAQTSFVPPALDITDPVELGSTAIGQYEDLASPLQMLRIAATIALGGLEPLPTFELVGHPRFPRVIPASVAHSIRKMMIAVVRQSDGTGVAAQIPGILVAGKTGTAQLTIPSCQTAASTGASGTTGVSASTTPTGATGPCAAIPNNPYDTDAWFVSFAPAFHPKIAVVVLLDHDGAGGTSAAPIARDLIALALQLGY